MTNPTSRDREGRIVPMTCACGATMNPHAEKLVVPVDGVESKTVDSVLDGVIEEVHQCPRCGRVQSRCV